MRHEAILRPCHASHPGSVPTASERDATGFGERLREARTRAGLTQAALAGERYTKAHISALEHGLANPSVEALGYLAERLGTSSASLLGGGDDRAWRRLEADLALAAGSPSNAAARYRALLEEDATGAGRAGSLLGLAEALCRLDRGREALPMAIAAAAAFEQLGNGEAAAEARYWQACAAYLMDAAGDARSLLVDLLERGRAGTAVGPDLHLRVLIAWAPARAATAIPKRALVYLEEARAMAADLTPPSGDVPARPRRVVPRAGRPGRRGLGGGPQPDPVPCLCRRR